MLKLFLWFLFFYMLYRLLRNLFAVVKTPNQGGNGNYQSSGRRQGDTTIISRPSSKSASEKEDGEYIDYKEVK